MRHTDGQPAMQIGLHSSNPDVLRERASELGLPLFDKLEPERLLDRLNGRPPTAPDSPVTPQAP